ncbi:MAG: sugar transferase [Candidatus Micrarchaeaceae archaeon]
MAKRTVILGTSAVALRVATELSARQGGYYNLIGVIGEERRVTADYFPCPHLGSTPDLREIVMEYAPKCIVVALDGKYDHTPIDQLIELRALRHIVVETGADVLERLSGKLAIDSLTAGSALFAREFRPKLLMLAIGRLISLCTALTGLTLSFPIMVLIALVVRIDSPGPVLFTQDRIGRGGQRFKLYKFRSMYPTLRKRSEWAGDNADEITRVGKWIRKFRLDELPQFINVVRGDMNIVGPRPHPLSNRELFVLVARNMPSCGQQIPYYSLRQSVLPGITGWAQVRYKYANGLDEEIEKLQYDLYYIKHYSPLLDMRILFETLKIVLCGHVENSRIDDPSSLSSGRIHGLVAVDEIEGSVAARLEPSGNLHEVPTLHVKVGSDMHRVPKARAHQVR